MRVAIVLAAITMCLTGFVQLDAAENSFDFNTPEEALQHWRDLGFGMFIHWGPVSLTGHEIGWSRGRQTPIKEYDNLYKRFNPTKFDANAWAATAKAAGMKYMVITTKHHDGFCLWPSDYTDYDIAATPFQRDVLKELSDACRRHGLEFGTYYSVCDWWHPDFPRGSPAGKTTKPNADIAKYDKYLRGQVEELVMRYGPLLTIWFDVPQVYKAEFGIPMVKWLRELQPDILINNRAYAGAPGDYTTPEQRIGGFNRERPWETCMTICRQWAWKPNDTMKSREQCLQTLIRTVGGDGNLLFNVGPTAEGVIEQRQVDRLKEMGDWLEQYGEGIYNTRGGPFKPGDWGASTCRGNTIYLFVTQWPNDGILWLPRIDAEVTEAQLVGKGDVTWLQNEQGIAVSVSAGDRDAVATPITLTLDRDALDVPPVAVPDRPSGSLAFRCKAEASNVFNGRVDQYGPQKALDDAGDTRWATDAGTSRAWLAVDLGEELTISRVVIDEAIEKRIRKYELQYRHDDAWRTIISGTTVGPDFSRTFDPVKARRVRLNILEATEGPTIWEFQLFPPER